MTRGDMVQHLGVCYKLYNDGYKTTTDAIGESRLPVRVLMGENTIRSVRRNVAVVTHSRSDERERLKGHLLTTNIKPIL